MASGRMLNKKICMSKQVNELSNDTCRLAFTWAIPHLDRDGRIHGDPVILVSWIFPRRVDVTPQDMAGYVDEWVACGLVERYEADGDVYLSFPKFRENQKKLRYDREPESSIPEPPRQEKQHVTNTAGVKPATSRQSAGIKPDHCGTKIREDKIREDKITMAATPPPPAVSGDNGLVDKKLYQAIHQSFLAKQLDERFTNYGMQGKAVNGIIAKIRQHKPEDEAELASKLLHKFWELRQGRDKFWRGQPFLPSVLNSAGIFDRVLAAVYDDAEEEAGAESARQIARGLQL